MLNSIHTQKLPQPGIISVLSSYVNIISNIITHHANI